MTDLSPIIISVMMFGCMIAVMLSGLPLTFALGAVGIGFAFWLWGPAAIDLTYFTSIEVMHASLFVAAPLFIFMGFTLRASGIIEDLFTTIHRWSGPVNGGVGMGTVIICAVLAAMVPGSAVATLTLGLIALPVLLKMGYDKRMATGTIESAASLGFLIPPSLVMIFYAFISGESLAKLFAAGVIPGLVLASMFIIYIAIRCRLNPKMGPALPPEERATWKEKFISLRAVILPIALVGSVMGLIVLGVTSATEASVIGAVGALICAAVRRRLNWSILKEVMFGTMKFTGLVFWIVLSAFAFSKVYAGLGAPQMIESLIVGLEINRWLVLGVMQLSFFILGMFLDDGAIMFICLPIYIPIITQLGFDSIWFAILYIVNMQMAYITPPLGYNLFFMRAVAPPEVTMRDITVSIIPFVAIQGTCLALIMLFPQIALWLPNMLFGS